MNNFQMKINYTFSKLLSFNQTGFFLKNLIFKTIPNFKICYYYGTI